MWVAGEVVDDRRQGVTITCYAAHPPNAARRDCRHVLCRESPGRPTAAGERWHAEAMSEPQVRPVMYCYDGSAGSKSALEKAATNLRPGPRLVVTAWQSVATRLRITPGLGAAMIGDASQSDDVERQAAREAAEEGARLATAAGLDSEYLIVEAPGLIWEVLVDVATERGAALVVCGAKGRSSFHDMIFGRTSAGLLHHAPCPVLIAREPAHHGG